MAASWTITKQVKGYCILFLLLETGMLGVFMALDFFLFYVFWEVMLLPMYFLIGIWGGPRKEYAAIKFFLYTLIGSVLMLIAILMLYFASDVRGLANAAFDPQHPNPIDWQSLHIGPSTTRHVGIGITDPNREVTEDIHLRNDARIAFLRKDGHAEQPLKVQFVPGGSSEASALMAVTTSAAVVSPSAMDTFSVLVAASNSADASDEPPGTNCTFSGCSAWPSLRRKAMRASLRR